MSRRDRIDAFLDDILYTDETVWGILFQIDQGSQPETMDAGGARKTESPAWNIPFTTAMGAGNT